MNIGDANATFAATLVDQWIVNGVRAAFVAPGSRSTPLAVAIANRPEIRLELLHDERSASFACLGWGLATGDPALLLCTSGTAATHFHGAVAEAGISCVPMLVCTANRPPELWGIGAPQTINQTDLYRASVRAFFQPGPPEGTSGWRELANESWLAAANGANPGPVQLDLSFREPLLGSVRDLEAPRPVPDRGSSPEPTLAQIEDCVDRLIDGSNPVRGVIVVGRGESPPAAIADLAEVLGWPVIADHRSGLRDSTALRFHDTLLRRWETDDLPRATTRILRFGEPLSSKVLGQWIGHVGADSEAITGFAPWSRTINPERVTEHRLPERSAARMLVAVLSSRAVVKDPGWVERWRVADRAVASAAEQTLTRTDNEPGIAVAVLDAVPESGALVVSSSMPVRDVEWFGPDRTGIDVYSNRGANGIDGVVATAVGIACTGVPTVCLIGDVALLHDQSTLTALARRNLDLKIVVVDNDGGGIFSFLPQHEQLNSQTYELLFGTPHGTDLAALFAAHGIAVTDNLIPAGVSATIFHTNRAESHALRRRLAERGV